MEEKNIKEKWYDKKQSIYFYMCTFLVFCFIGWIYEVIWEFAIGNGFVNRGFLFGPYLPIYGFGGLLLIFLLKKLMCKKIKIGKLNITPIIVFLAILFIVSVIEYFTSWGMEMIFHKRWWDYSYDILNINGRVSLRNSSLLAAGGMGYLYLVMPLITKLLSKFKDKTVKIIGLTSTIVISLDFIITIIGYLK